MIYFSRYFDFHVESYNYAFVLNVYYKIYSGRRFLLQHDFLII